MKSYSDTYKQAGVDEGARRPDYDLLRSDGPWRLRRPL